MKIRQEYIVLMLGATVAMAAYLAGAFRRGRIRPSGMTAAFIGDSQMANFTKSGWQNQLASKYNLLISSVPQNNASGASKTSNLAQVGKTTAWMKSILGKYYREWAYRPDMLFIYGGGNDISNGAVAETVVQNTQDMVDLARSFGTKNVYVIPGYLSTKVSLPKNVIKEKDAYERDRYKKMLISEIKGATVLPIWEIADSTYSSDGLHISDSRRLKELADFIGGRIFS